LGEGASVATSASLAGWNVLGSGTMLPAGAGLPAFLHLTRQADLLATAHETTIPLPAGTVGTAWSFQDDEDGDDDDTDSDDGRAGSGKTANTAAARAESCASAFGALQTAVAKWQAAATATSVTPLTATSAEECGKAVAVAAASAFKLRALSTSAAAASALCMRAGFLALVQYGAAVPTAGRATTEGAKPVGAEGAGGDGMAGAASFDRFRDGVLAIVHAIGVEPTPANMKNMALEVRGAALLYGIPRLPSSRPPSTMRRRSRATSTRSTGRSPTACECCCRLLSTPSPCRPPHPWRSTPARQPRCSPPGHPCSSCS